MRNNKYRCLEQKYRVAEIINPLRLEEAKEIVGKSNVYDIREVKKRLDIQHYGKIEDIPFNQEELEFARKNDMYLIYRPKVIWKNNRMHTLTIENMVDVSKRELIKDESKQGYSWEFFYQQEKPRSGWSLVSRNFNMITLDRNFFEQILLSTKILQEKTNNFKNIFRYLGEQIGGYMDEYTNIYQEYKKDAAAASGRLLQNPLISSFSRNAPEVVYDFLVTNHFPGMTKNYSLSPTQKVNMDKSIQYVEDDIHCWTNTMHSDNSFVLIERRRDMKKNQFVLRIDHSYLDFYDNDIGIIPVINY